MSKQEHTPVKLKIRHDMFGAVHVFNDDGDRLTNDRMCGTQGWEDISARIVASWNACDGISTESLEQGCIAEMRELIRDAIEDQTEFETEWNKAAREILAMQM